jgi:hypothetical protein
MILVAGRSGVVELINPSTLETVGRIQFDFGLQSVGLNGVSVSADGSLLYVEGPIPNEPNGCCVLYSVELATLQAKVAASFFGSRSRNAFVVSDGLVYAAMALTPKGIPREMSNDRLHLSPDGRWLFGVKSFRGPTLDVYDVGRGQVVRQLTRKGSMAIGGQPESGPAINSICTPLMVTAQAGCGAFQGTCRSWGSEPQSIQLAGFLDVRTNRRSRSPQLPATSSSTKNSDSKWIAETGVRAECREVRG